VASGLWDLLPGGRPSSPYGDYTPRSMQGACSAGVSPTGAGLCMVAAEL